MARRLKKPTYQELEEALQEAQTEAAAWRICVVFPEPDFILPVDLCTYDGTEYHETWQLHGGHRVSGPVLRILHDDGSQTVRFLMHAHSGKSPYWHDSYRESALAKCRAWTPVKLETTSP